MIVDWPHKQESKSYFPPKGYAFLIFTYERSVQELIDECVIDDSKLYMCVSSPSMKDKAVQIRPWLLADSDFVMDGTQPLDPRKTIFVGGVPRPLRAGKENVMLGFAFLRRQKCPEITPKNRNSGVYKQCTTLIKRLIMLF